MLFDLDGTLTRLDVDWRVARAELTRVSGESFGGVSIFSMIAQIAARREGEKEKLFAALDALEVPASEFAAPTEGARGLLSFLSTRTRLGLVTMQGRRACTVALRVLEFGEFFGSVITREDSLEREKQLLMAASKLDVGGTEILFVGDKHDDAIGGRKAGATVALVGPQARSDWGANYVFPSLSELHSFLAGSRSPRGR